MRLSTRARARRGPGTRFAPADLLSHRREPAARRIRHRSAAGKARGRATGERGAVSAGSCCPPHIGCIRRRRECGDQARRLGCRGSFSRRCIPACPYGARRGRQHDDLQQLPAHARRRRAERCAPAAQGAATGLGQASACRPRGATIGRSRDCDIVLEDSSISRRHAELRPGGQGWTIEDLGSTNGVRVNGNTVHGPREVRTGDRIEIGSTEMLFEIAP